MPYYLDAGEMYLAIKVEIMREGTILASRLAFSVRKSVFERLNDILLVCVLAILMK